VSAREWGRGCSRRIGTRDIPAPVKALVDERQGGRACALCGEPGTVLDHMQPLSRGGDNHWTNLRWLCEPCNVRRGATPDRHVGVPRRLRG